MNTTSYIEISNKKKIFIFLFILFLLVDLFATGLHKEDWRFFSKPLLMPLLIGHFLANTTSKSPVRTFIVLALFFSWVGDLLLMFQERQTIFFLLGLSFFLIAHIFYIVFFQAIRIMENIKNRWWLLIIVAFYYAFLITLLYPHLADMRLPVLVYGIVISFMLLLALHMIFITNKAAGKWMMAGAVLFILSDSVLAINKFYQPFGQAGLITMLTYGLAQFFIVRGALLYISSAKERVIIPA